MPKLTKFSRVLRAIAATFSGAVAMSATDPAPDAPPPPVEAVVLHRLFREFYFSSEHFDGEETALGDALGTDCLVQRVVSGPNGKGRIPRAFAHDGARNEDWYGWNAHVLAPFDGTVERVHLNPKTNEPGEFGDAPASSIVFLRSDGLRVMFAHVQNVRVASGDRVEAGQAVAQVGNNGYGSCPHIHAGAWRDGRPLQIRWDLRSGKTLHP